MTSLREHVLAQLERDEGYRQHPYTDTVGKTTVGFGRNLDDVGLSRAEARDLLENDLDKVIARIADRWPWTGTLSEPRLGVLLNMAVNLGVFGLGGFTRMFTALKAGDYETAANEMLHSRWAAQVGDRAQRLALQMRLGQWTEDPAREAGLKGES